MLTVNEFTSTPPSKLRLKEAQFFLGKFEDAGKAGHNDTLFLMTSYLDAFLFTFVSIEEMVPDDIKAELRNLEIFKFFKALRNISTHHVILSASSESKFKPAVSRQVHIGVNCKVPQNAKFFIHAERLQEIFDTILIGNKNERHTIPNAKAFLAKEQVKNQRVILLDLMKKAVNDVFDYVV